MPYYDNYGGGGDARDRITQALLQVQNPPPMTQMPPPPPMPQMPQNLGGASPMAVPQAASMTPGTPGAPGQPSPMLAPSPMAAAGASNPLLPSTMPGAQPSQLGAQQSAAMPTPQQY
ncbi:hypothetical protein EHM76_04230 [bacterium]|nr:MAG: hypothetical protein EHM76_04230 [bacterium]